MATPDVSALFCELREIDAKAATTSAALKWIQHSLMDSGDLVPTLDGVIYSLEGIREHLKKLIELE